MSHVIRDSGGSRRQQFTAAPYCPGLYGGGWQELHSSDPPGTSAQTHTQINLGSSSQPVVCSVRRRVCFSLGDLFFIYYIPEDNMCRCRWESDGKRKLLKLVCFLWTWLLYNCFHLKMLNLNLCKDIICGAVWFRCKDKTRTWGKHFYVHLSFDLKTQISLYFQIENINVLLFLQSLLYLHFWYIVYSCCTFTRFYSCCSKK